MKKRHTLLGYYNYTVVLTYIGMLTGFAGIIVAFDHRLLTASLCLMIAGLCDMFDGTIASTKKDRTEQEKCFGIQIDSLSDLICFGLLPASIICVLNNHHPLALIIGGFYVLCALIRLAYFNVDEQERQKHNSGSREIYYGMPVTLSAMFLPLFYSVAHIFPKVPDTILTALLFVMAVLFLVPIQLRKPKRIGKILIVILGLLELFFMIYAFVGV